MPYCRHVLRDESEHAMVRHEAAEALGSIASPDCLQLLTDYCQDPEPIVADSCVVSVYIVDSIFKSFHGSLTCLGHKGSWPAYVSCISDVGWCIASGFIVRSIYCHE